MSYTRGRREGFGWWVDAGGEGRRGEEGRKEQREEREDGDRKR